MVLSARTKHALGRSRHSANISAHILSRLILSSGLSWRLQSLMGFLTRPFEEFDLDCRICSSRGKCQHCPLLSFPVSRSHFLFNSAPTICSYNLLQSARACDTGEHPGDFFCALFFALETSSDSALAQSTELLPSSQLCKAAKHHETIGLLFFLSFHTNINI